MGLRSICLISLSVGAALSACGLHVPSMREPYQSEEEYADENTVISQVRCELRKGVYDALIKYHADNPTSAGNSVAWLEKWGAKVTLNLTVDEKGGLAPGASLTTPFANAVQKFPSGPVTSPQSLTIGLGAQASADANRKETTGFTYAFIHLLEGTKFNPLPPPHAITVPDEVCNGEDGILIHSDLKIAEFIDTKVYAASTSDAQVGPDNGFSPYSTFTDDVSFIVSYGLNFTPTWKFVTFTATTNPTGSLLSATRTKTQEIILTLGPVDHFADAKGPTTLAQDAQAVHNANLISSGISATIQQAQQQP